MPGLDNYQLRLLFFIMIKQATYISIVQTYFSPAHKRQRLLSLHLSPLTRQLLLLVCESLLHQHHPNALLHRVLLGLRYRVELLRVKSRQRSAENPQYSRSRARSEDDIADLLDVVDRLLNEVLLRARVYKKWKDWISVTDLTSS